MDHAADRSPDHKGRTLLVERTTAGVGVHVLVTELSILDSVTSH